MSKSSKSILTITVLVAALGYFVDIYDLLLFSIVRVESLKELAGHSDPLLIKSKGEFIIGIQMIGLLIGGIIWGIMGDKKGRLSVLFGSIILYSVANIFNGFVQTTGQYALVRFIAGIGLAGELGAGITLVSELIHKDKRGLSTSLVAGIGLTGAVVAFFVAKNFGWRICYFIGGGLGFGLLLLRISVFESTMFNAIKEKNVVRGNFLMFFDNPRRFKKYLFSILLGLPTWYVIGILITFSREFAEKMNVNGIIEPGKAVMFAYAAISVGDVAAGFISHWLKSRKKAIFLFYILTAAGIAWFFNLNNQSAGTVYVVAAFLGFGTGFWALFVTMAAEQFGTNLRATAATTVPNMVRGSLPLVLALFNWLQSLSFSYINAGWITGTVVMLISVVAVAFTEETFGKDLNYTES